MPQHHQPTPLNPLLTKHLELLTPGVMHITPLEATAAMDSLHASKEKEAMSSEIGIAYPVDPTPVSRVCVQRSTQEGNRWEAPPSPTIRSDTATPY